MTKQLQQVQKNFNKLAESYIQPDYYHKGGIDVIGFMETKVNKDEMRGFFRGNALKYVTRFHEKNGVDDLRKAKYYLDRLIELEEEK